ncbi:MAG: glycosyltransferase family 39 protein [Acidobacteria bacterium]|nr:glycosyltransferase family 39 protein [Acidobacteriota bacterium]
MLVGIPLVLLPYVWLAKRRGYVVGAAAGAMLALSPNIVAFSAVATTDACVVLCTLGALYALDRCAEPPSWDRFVLADLAMGVALAAKYSAVFIAPVAMVVLTRTAIWRARTSGAQRVLPRAFVAFAAVLVLMQVGSAVSTAPRYLSYMNALFTRVGDGYKYVADSNFDWGQDLPALKREVGRRGAAPVLLAYFGSVSPGSCGLDAVPWDSPDEGQVARCRWFALSASELDGLGVSGSRLRAFLWLGPDAHAADTILLYKTDRPEVRRALAEARKSSSVSPAGNDTMAVDFQPRPLRSPVVRGALMRFGGWLMVTAVGFVVVGVCWYRE